MKMKRSFVSFPVTIMLVMIVFSAAAGVSAQETVPGERPDVPYEYRECVLSDEQESQIFDAVLSGNETLQDYNVKELRYINCHYGWRDGSARDENVIYFYGSTELRDGEGEIRYSTVSFNGNMTNESMEFAYVSEPWTEYNFTGYFTEEEDAKLGYYLKQMLVDIEVYGEEDAIAWIQVSQWPQYRCLLDTTSSDAKSAEIARCIPPEEMDWAKFRANFEGIVSEMNPADSFYYENQWNAMGLVKVPLSRARELLKDWVTYVSFFGEELKFSFYGNASVSANIDNVIEILRNQGIEVCDPWDSTCDYDEDGMAYYSPERLGFYAYKNYGQDAYFSANINGIVGKEATLYAYLSGREIEHYVEDAKAMTMKMAEIAGVDIGEIEFTDRTSELIPLKPTPLIDVEIEEAVAEETPPGDSGSSGSARPPEEEYKHLRFEAKVVIPGISEPMPTGWKKEEGLFYTSYTNDNMGITVGKPYVSYWQKSGEYSYDSVQIGEDLAYASVVLDEADFEKAGNELTGKIGAMATVTGEWNLEYYPVGDGGWGPVYRYGILEAGTDVASRAPSGGMINEQAPQPPSFENTFGEAFENLKTDVEAETPQPPAAPVNIIAVIVSAIITVVTPFLRLLLG
jgi:hypothetical protein